MGIEAEKEKTVVMKPLKDMNLMDDFLLRSILAHHPENETFCRIVFGTILNRPIGNITIHAQEDLPGVEKDKHGVRLDVSIEEREDGSVDLQLFEIEVDNNHLDAPTLLRRVRYYIDTLDIHHLDSAADYRLLPDVMVIFISSYDPFGRGLMYYNVEKIINHDPGFPADDGAHSIYLYTKGENNTGRTGLAEMLQYFQNTTVENVCNPDLAELDRIVSTIKDDERTRVQYMRSYEHEQQVLEEGVRKGIEQGKELGLEQGKNVGRTETLQAILDVQGERKRGINEHAILENIMTRYSLSKEIADQIMQAAGQ